MTLHEIFGAIFLFGFASVILFMIGAIIYLFYISIKERIWPILILMIVVLTFIGGAAGYDLTR